MTDARFSTDGRRRADRVRQRDRARASVELDRAPRPRRRSDSRGAARRGRRSSRCARRAGAAPSFRCRPGEYELRIQTATGASPDPLGIRRPWLSSARSAPRSTGSTLTIGPPIDPAYDSGEGQAALERRYATRPAALENAVFFESFYGRNASCNPLAIDREIARRAPGVTRYWSVVDLSVQVPDGAMPVVDGSPEWWRARGSARLLVVNDWLRRTFARRPGQMVVQTWHGTPLKRLALHRPGFDPRRMAAVVKESRRWNVLLAQNPYAASILRKAYAFLVAPDLGRRLPAQRCPRERGRRRHARRARVSAQANESSSTHPPGATIATEMVDFVDPAALAEATDAVVLVRGHSRTLLPGRDAEGPRVVDVTGFPDTSLLLLVADALITDYSSVMFDFQRHRQADVLPRARHRALPRRAAGLLLRPGLPRARAGRAHRGGADRGCARR